MQRSLAAIGAAKAFPARIGLSSGSLYAPAASGVRWLAFVTPAGGAAFPAGWVPVAAPGSDGR